MAEAWATAANELDTVVRSTGQVGPDLERDLFRLVAVWDDRHSTAAASAMPDAAPGRRAADVVPR